MEAIDIIISDACRWMIKHRIGPLICIDGRMKQPSHRWGRRAVGHETSANLIQKSSYFVPSTTHHALLQRTSTYDSTAITHQSNIRNTININCAMRHSFYNAAATLFMFVRILSLVCLYLSLGCSIAPCSSFQFLNWTYMRLIHSVIM